MADSQSDRVMRFLREFARMSDEQRDAAIDALAPEDRDAVLALSEARGSAAGANLIEALDAGHGGLDTLREVADPASLYAVIGLAVKERPQLVLEALFAAVVLYRGWDPEERSEFSALREQWHWHIHERITAEHERAEVRGEPGAS